MFKGLCTELKTVLEICSSCKWGLERMMVSLFCVSMTEHQRLVYWSQQTVCE